MRKSMNGYVSTSSVGTRRIEQRACW